MTQHGLTAEERFWQKVFKTDQCWQWLGPNNHGYGVFKIRNTTVSAHRWSYTNFVGPIPPKLEIDHLCNNTMCVNPAHLEAVTHIENMKRRRNYPKVRTPF